MGFFITIDIDVLFAGLGVFEHLGAARTTAETFAAAALHLHQVGVECLYHLPGCFVNTVGAAQVAGVVKGDFFAFESASFFEPYFSLVDQLLKESRVVHHLIVASQLGVFVFQGIEAMGA